MHWSKILVQYLQWLQNNSVESEVEGDDDASNHVKRDLEGFVHEGENWELTTTGGIRLEAP